MFSYNLLTNKFPDELISLLKSKSGYDAVFCIVDCLNNKDLVKFKSNLDNNNYIINYTNNNNKLIDDDNYNNIKMLISKLNKNLLID